MNPEIIGYRYSRAELTVLMRLMGIPELPGFTPDALDEDSYNAAIASLVNAHLATRGEGKVFVDRITALILSAMHRRLGSICLETTDRTAALIRSDIMYILAEYPRRGSCILTPLQRAEDVSDPALSAAARCEFPALLRLQASDGTVRSDQADSKNSAQPILAEMFKILCTDADSPTER